MELKDYRNKIDQINRDLVRLLDERMRTAEGVADYKVKNNMRVFDPVREREVLDEITDMSAEDMAYYNRILFDLIMELTSDHERRVLGYTTPLVEEVKSSIENTSKIFPERASVACQGVQGAFSQEACDKFFKMPKITYKNSFEGVFNAVERGDVEYGVLPIENSTAGTVNQVYKLMMEKNFYIVKSGRVKIDHNLLVNQGVKKEDIKEIFSHEQALNQSSDYLNENFPDAKITVFPNTAMAAKMIAESGRRDAAALASIGSANAYDLEILDSSVQDQDNNYTRFICISKKLEIYPGAGKTSVMMVLNHKPGALYRVLSRFNAMGVNLVKLESRPLPEREFEFMFYFDIEESVYSENYIRMISQLQEMSLQFKFLGSYLEV